LRLVCRDGVVAGDIAHRGVGGTVAAAGAVMVVMMVVLVNAAGGVAGGAGGAEGVGAWGGGWSCGLAVMGVKRCGMVERGGCARGW
jgi:hypothetical protein